MWAFFFFRQCCRNAESLELRQWTRAGKRPFYYYYKQKRGWNTKVFRHILKCNRNSTVISQFYNCKSNPYEINGWFNPGYFKKVEDTSLNRTILMFVKIFTKMEILVSQKLLPPPHSTQTTIFSTKKREKKLPVFIFFYSSSSRWLLVTRLQWWKQNLAKCTHIYQFILIDEINLCKLVDKANFK